MRMLQTTLLWMRWLGVLLCAPAVTANSNGLPLGYTGAFGEPACNACHRPDPLPAGSGRVTVDVGPYIPAQTQRVVVTVYDTNSQRFGFQLAARVNRNPQQPAGSFSVVPDDQNVRVWCADRSAPPCGSGLQYVTHTSVGTRVFRWSVDWAAPATDVGDVIFTVAAVGASGSPGGAEEDRTFTTTAISLYAPSNRPAIREGGVVSAASFQAPSGAVGQGSLVSVFGEKLAPSGFKREVTREDLTSDGRLPIELSRIGLDFVAPGQDPVPAYVLYVSEGQMNIQVPALPPVFGGRWEVQPVFNRGRGGNEVRGNRVPVGVSPLAPALFTFDGRSVAAVHSAIPAGAPVGRTGQFPNSRPARPGDVILVFGTGFGPTSPPVEPGALAPQPAPLTGGVSARIGGLALSPADILYAGAAPTFAGLQQFNLRIPAGLGSGDLPIVLGIGGLETQAGVTIRIEP